MSRSRMRRVPLSLGWLLLLLAGAVFADPPGRVGRLADLQGQVWMYSPESGEWVAAQRNRPLTGGDRLSTDSEARAELRIGSAALRMDGGTELEIQQLDDSAIRVQLHNGSLAVRLRSGEIAREFVLVTSEGRFQPQRAGRFRFDHSDETSHATAWSGQLLFEGRDNAVTVMAGQRAEIWRDGRTQYTLTEPVRDAFSEWVAARDEADERSASARYVSPETTGIEELDRDGRWESSVEYGPIWIPHHVAPGWAPYRYGHWAWVHPWGWTWVDDARWGFAPSHYGRWVYHRSVWCWSPGRYVARPIYAPALVAWVGGPRVSVSINIGPSVGWFPLAPREIYVPAYKASPRHIRSINVAHGAHVGDATLIASKPDHVVRNSSYAYRGQAHAVTVVPANVVTNRLPVRNAVHSDARLVRDLSREPVSAQAPVSTPVAVQRVDVNRGPRERIVAPGSPATDRTIGVTRRVVPSGEHGSPALARQPAPAVAGLTEPRAIARQPAPPPAAAVAPAAPAATVAAPASPAAREPRLVQPGRSVHSGPPAREQRGRREYGSEQPAAPIVAPRPAMAAPRVIAPASPVVEAPRPVLQTPPVRQANPEPVRIIRAQPQVPAPAAQAPVPVMRSTAPGREPQSRIVSPQRMERGGGRPTGRERML